MNASVSAEPRDLTPNQECQVREAASQWVMAMHEKAVDRVIEHYGPGAVTFGLAPPLEAAGDRRAGLKAWFDTWLGPIDIDTQRFKVLVSGDLALTHALLHLTGRRKLGETVSLWYRATVALRGIGGRWLIVHEHHSVPFDMSTGAACLELAP